MKIDEAKKETVKKVLQIIDDRIKEYKKFEYLHNESFHKEIVAMEVLKKIIKKEYKKTYE